MRSKLLLSFCLYLLIGYTLCDDSTEVNIELDNLSEDIPNIDNEYKMKAYKNATVKEFFTTRRIILLLFTIFLVVSAVFCLVYFNRSKIWPIWKMFLYETIYDYCDTHYNEPFNYCTTNNTHIIWWTGQKNTHTELLCDTADDQYTFPTVFTSALDTLKDNGTVSVQSIDSIIGFLNRSRFYKSMYRLIEEKIYFKEDLNGYISPKLLKDINYQFSLTSEELLKKAYLDSLNKTLRARLDPYIAFYVGRP
ncbi:hypothetical protein NEOKW01_1780 [Nematocida sp. AWRm80]|nr:hypothetical protein NEOKW01_1780 [Nematocida sp. AWRm80]